jgi:inhibitor of cysteine peptidase
MKNKLLLSIILLILSVLTLSACASKRLIPIPPSGNANMANPASVFCKDKGGREETRKSPDGGEYGVCIFSDGSECDEWAYYRGECSPGSKSTALVPTSADQNTENKAVEAARIQLSQKTSVDANAIAVLSLEKADWPDACLGLPNPDEVCAAVVTPGFRVVLAADGKNYTFRTDLTGSNIRQETANTQ